MGKFIQVRDQLLRPQSIPIGEEIVKSSEHSKSDRKQKRRVRFGERQVHVFKADYSKNDTEDIWYTRNELGEIAADNTRMIKKEKKYLEINHEDQRGRQRREDKIGWSWRGYEWALQKYGKFQLRKEHSRKVISFQYICGSDDLGLALADHARNNSIGNGSTLRARSVAINDQLEAARYQKDNASISNMRKSKTLPRDFKQRSSK